MFTIKYRFYEPAPTPPDATQQGFTPVERIDGPFESVSSRWENGWRIVIAERDNPMTNLPMTYGPASNGPTPEEIAEFEKQSGLAGQGKVPAPAPIKGWFPRPTLWVMNASGATVAKYDL